MIDENNKPQEAEKSKLGTCLRAFHDGSYNNTAPAQMNIWDGDPYEHPDDLPDPKQMYARDSGKDLGNKAA